MPIPAYQSLMLPLLRLASDGAEHVFRDTVTRPCGSVSSDRPERQQPLPSRTQPVFHNRVGWARTYLVKAGLLQSPRRGIFQITQRGLDTLQSTPQRISASYLKKNFEEFRDFVAPKADDDATALGPGDTAADERTPEELLESAYQTLRAAVESELLARLKSASPDFFERVVVQLLVAMGYGGSLRDAGQAIGKSGDEGIDGIIKEDRLGLDVIYVQAKRWEAAVGRPEIQKFAGALQGQRARKGVFITTSAFSSDAKTFVANIESKIILIDGEKLVQFMFDHNDAKTAALTDTTHLPPAVRRLLTSMRTTRQRAIEADRTAAAQQLIRTLGGRGLFTTRRTPIPSRASISMSVSVLNRSMRPRSRSLTRGCVTLRTLRGFGLLQPSRLDRLLQMNQQIRPNE